MFGVTFLPLSFWIERSHITSTVKRWGLLSNKPDTQTIPSLVLPMARTGRQVLVVVVGEGGMGRRVGVALGGNMDRPAGDSVFGDKE